MTHGAVHVFGVLAPDKLPDHLRKLLLDVHDVAKALDVSCPKVYQLNRELEERGRVTVSGEIGGKYLEEGPYGRAEHVGR